MTRSSGQAPAFRLAADIGGTFTDIAAFDEKGKRLLLGKVLSTPPELLRGINMGVEKAGTTLECASLFLHGSTIAINTLLERTGARTALLTTEGFRDVYEIGRVNRPDAYNLFFKKHRPLIERALCFEVPERIRADGSVHRTLDESKVVAICDRLVELGIEAVAILFLHSYRNPDHELRVKRIVARRLPEAFVTASHELSEEYREFERCSTVVANAYIGPRVKGYISGIERYLEDHAFRGSFMVVQSTGGLYDAKQAQSECLRMLESGPAAGVIGTQALCEALSIDNAIAFDMGGTTAKAGVIHDGETLTTGAALIGGYNTGLPIQIAMTDIFEVGTGGGSIARLDEGGAMRVGPQSAGAVPGPACYGRGGSLPTVTDANLLLGRLGADRFLGGEMALDVAAAETAVRAHLAGPLGLSVVEAAEGILQIAATAMSYAVKGVSTERGLDAASFTLVAYGGAGPLHASAVAREIGMGELIVPRAPGHFSAFGMLYSDLRYDYVHTWFKRLAEAPFEEIRDMYARMVDEGRRAVERSAATPRRIVIRYAMDMRYVGQEHAVTVDVSAALVDKADRAKIKRLFDAVHGQRYGTSAPKEAAEVVGLRVTVVGTMRRPPLERIARGGPRPSAAAAHGKRRVHFAELGRFVETPTFQRSALKAGNRIAGPALIEEHASTTVLLPGDQLRVDEYGNLRIAVGGRVGR